MFSCHILKVGRNHNAVDGRTQLSAFQARADAGNLGTEILGLSAVCARLRGPMRQVVLHGEHRCLVFGIGRCKVSAPLPVVQGCQHISGGDALALVNIDCLHISIDRCGNGNQVLWSDERVARDAHGHGTEYEEKQNHGCHNRSCKTALAAGAQQPCFLLHQRFNQADERNLAIEQRIANGDGGLPGENLDHLNVRQTQKVGNAAFVQQQPDASLVVGQGQRKQAAITCLLKMARDGSGQLRLRLRVRFIVPAQVQRIVFGREPAQQLMNALYLAVAHRKARHSGDSLQLQASAMIERNGAEFIGEHVLWTVDDDLQQTVEAQRGSDLGADVNERFKNGQLALGEHEARVLERAADGFSHRGEEEEVIVVEGPVFAVDGFKDPDFGLILDERDKQRVADGRDAAFF